MADYLPGGCRMKKLTDLINLIAAVVRLIEEIIRTGWV
jgi:hypothetical protein